MNFKKKKVSTLPWPLSAIFIYLPKMLIPKTSLIVQWFLLIVSLKSMLFVMKDLF